MNKNQHEKCKILKQKINKANSIALFWHKSIDGDCIGSMLARGLLLEKLGKTVSYYTPDKPDNHFSFIKNIEKIKTDFPYTNHYDLMFFLDFSSYKRIGKFTNKKETYFKKQTVIIIDHHPEDNENIKDHIKNPQASSNCERIRNIIKHTYPKLIDKEIATYLYLWLVTDTGNMTYENNPLETSKNAYELIQHGADKKFIINNMLRKIKINTMKLLQICLERLTYHNKDIIYTYYTLQELQTYNAGTTDIDYIIYNCQNIEKIKVFCMFKVTDEKIKISLRSKNNEEWENYQGGVDVSSVAKKMGGGGHYYAAGGEIKRHNKNYQKEINNILEIINSEIEKQENTKKKQR